MPTATGIAQISGAPQGVSGTTSDSDPQNLTEQQLKASLTSIWKKHHALAKPEMASLFYWLREKLRAQGARNDLADKDRGFGAWVEDHLGITRRTADRWCDWYATQTGLKPASTSGQMSKSDELYEDILSQHETKRQITVNYWVETDVHAEFQRSLAQIQEKLGLKDKKEALVKGVIYAASVIDK